MKKRYRGLIFGFIILLSFISAVVGFHTFGRAINDYAWVLENPVQRRFAINKIDATVNRMVAESLQLHVVAFLETPEQRQYHATYIYERILVLNEQLDGHFHDFCRVLSFDSRFSTDEYKEMYLLQREIISEIRYHMYYYNNYYLPVLMDYVAVGNIEGIASITNFPNWRVARTAELVEQSRQISTQNLRIHTENAELATIRAIFLTMIAVGATILITSLIGLFGFRKTSNSISEVTKIIQQYESECSEKSALQQLEEQTQRENDTPLR